MCIGLKNTKTSLRVFDFSFNVGKFYLKTCSHVLILLDKRPALKYSGSGVFEPPKKKQNLVREIRELEKSGVKLHCLTEGGEPTFGSRHQRKNSMRPHLLNFSFSISIVFVCNCFKYAFLSLNVEVYHNNRSILNKSMLLPS